MTARCRSCDAEILWALTEHGRRIPLDAEPRLEGDGFHLMTDDETPLAVYNGGTPVHTSHFATCPNADQHRRPRPTFGGERRQQQ